MFDDALYYGRLDGNRAGSKERNMPLFAVVPMDDAQRKRAPTKSDLLLKEYQEYIDLVGTRQAGKLTAFYLSTQSYGMTLGDSPFMGGRREPMSHQVVPRDREAAAVPTLSKLDNPPAALPVHAHRCSKSVPGTGTPGRVGRT